MSTERKLHLDKSISVEVDRRKGVEESEDRLKEEQKKLRIAELDRLLLQLNAPELLKNLRDEVWGFGKIVRAVDNWRGEYLSYSLVAEWLHFQPEYTIEMTMQDETKKTAVVARYIETRSAVFSIGAIAIPPCAESRSAALGLRDRRLNASRYIAIHDSRLDEGFPHSSSKSNYMGKRTNLLPGKPYPNDQSSRGFEAIDGWGQNQKLGKPSDEVWKLTGEGWSSWNPGECSELLETEIVNLLVKEKEELSSSRPYLWKAPLTYKEASIPSVENAVKRGVELPEGAENLEGYSFSFKK